MVKEIRKASSPKKTGIAKKVNLKGRREDKAMSYPGDQPTGACGEAQSDNILT